ncbi:5'-nucleosidase [Bacillus spizizenii]|nr:5'-nucleosidase [Bacillus spizizenii]MCY8130699.1 5'-nucleosidase [Bacillus spizizenii]
MFSYFKNNNYSILIASNGLIEYQKAIASFYQLDRWVTEIFSIQQIHTLNKSDFINTILQKYVIQHAAVVGDRLSDINAAKDNGLLAIGCYFDFTKEEAQADFVTHN